MVRYTGPPADRQRGGQPPHKAFIRPKRENGAIKNHNQLKIKG